MMKWGNKEKGIYKHYFNQPNVLKLAREGTQ